MLHKKFNPTTPSRRVFTDLGIFDNLPIKKRYFNLPQFTKRYFKQKNKQKNLFGLRSLKMFKSFSVLVQCFKPSIYVVKGFIYNKKLVKEYSVLENIYNQTLVYPSLKGLYPGRKVMPHNFFSLKRSVITLFNSIIFISQIPFLSSCCYINNILKMKITFSLSSGSNSIRLKAKKKYKLAKLKLPSTTIMYLPLSTTCIFGSLINLGKNKLKKGKATATWDYLQTTKVRGVAKNPVDHPNGGRTKSKSPEKSP